MRTGGRHNPSLTRKLGALVCGLEEGSAQKLPPPKVFPIFKVKHALHWTFATFALFFYVFNIFCLPLELFEFLAKS